VIDKGDVFVGSLILSCLSKVNVWKKIRRSRKISGDHIAQEVLIINRFTFYPHLASHRLTVLVHINRVTCQQEDASGRESQKHEPEGNIFSLGM